MNKKILSRIFIALLTLVLAVSCLASCDNGKKPDEGVSKNESSPSVSKDESITNFEQSESENSDDNSFDDSSDPNGDASINDESSKGETSDTEIIGQGSKDDPYYEIPTEDRKVTTVSVPAGKSLFYGIYRVGGTILKIKSDNVYVVCDGKRYDSKNGKLSFTVPDALASDAVMFEIGNKGDKDESFVIEFANAEGSQMNPAEVKTIGKEYEVSLEEGQATGYYYRYVAEKSGTIRFYMEATADGDVVATNNRNSAQRSFGELDEEVDYFELVVEEGDEIIINVCAKPTKRGKYPAITISWRGEFA